MLKILFFVVYFIIGLYFMSQTIGIATTDKYKNSHGNKNGLFLAILLTCLSELFLWPIWIVITAGYVHGKKNYEESSESNKSID